MTEELKKALEEAVTDEQKKAVLEKFKEEIQKLDQEELDRVCGGDPLWAERHKELFPKMNRSRPY